MMLFLVSGLSLPEGRASTTWEPLEQQILSSSHVINGTSLTTPPAAVASYSFPVWY